eukprot:11583481-Alexandrium_andersonii.AAC.1
MTAAPAYHSQKSNGSPSRRWSMTGGSVSAASGRSAALSPSGPPPRSAATPAGWPSPWACAGDRPSTS